MSTTTFNVGYVKDFTGNVCLMPIKHWALAYLSSADYAKYQAAQARQDAIVEAHVNSGAITISNISASPDNLPDGWKQNTDGDPQIAAALAAGGTVAQAATVPNGIGHPSNNVPHFADEHHVGHTVTINDPVTTTNNDPEWLAFWDQYRSDTRLTFDN